MVPLTQGNTMNIKRLALLTVAATSLATAAYAAGPNGGHGGFLKSADLNKDGVIDQSEFQQSRDKWFADLDSNKDGFVTADELKAFGEKMHAEWAKKHADQADKADANKKHGEISKAEFDAEGSKLFARLDDNGDGKIAANEMPQRHWARFGGRMFDRMDADKDGKVTKAEFEAAGDKFFQRLDKNGDGIIEKDEMQKPHGGQPPADGQAPNP
jgi:Ca2+-binding EF-hand superfamily protein